MKTRKVFMLVIFFSIFISMNLLVFAEAENQLPETDKLEEAVLIKPGTYTGSLGEKREGSQIDNDDYYSIEVEEGQLIALKLAIPGNANYQIYLLNPNQSSRGTAITEKESKILDYVANSTGTWYIKIHRSSGEGEYQLSLDIQNQNDADSGQDAGKSIQEAIPISSGSITGFLKAGDNDDYYSIEVEEGQLIALKLAIPGNANYQISLLDPNRNSRGSANIEKELKLLDYVAGSTGTWYIKIHRSSGEGEYQLSVDIKNQNDADSGQDAGKSVQEAISLSPGTITGFLKAGDSDDYYSIEAEEGQLIALKLTIPGNANYQISLLDPNRNSRGSANIEKELKLLDYVAGSTGTWYIKIHRSSGEGEYQLSLDISAGQPGEETDTSAEERDVARKDDNYTYRQTSTEETSESPENQPPVASCEFPPIAMAEVDVPFDASLSYDPDGEIISYEWEFKEKDETLGRIENEEKVSYYFTAPGMYEVILYVTDNEGAKSMVVYTIEIIPLTDQPVARFTYVSIGTDEEDYFSFDGSSSYGPSTITEYEWDFGDGSTTETGEQVNHQFAAPGTYQVTLIVEDQDGEGDKETKNIDTTISSLTASFTISPREAGVLDSVQFDASASHGPGHIEIYEWDFGDDSEAGDEMSVEHSFNASGNYTVQLTVTDDSGATSIASDIITVLAIDDEAFIQCGTIQAASGDRIPFRALFEEQPIVVTSAVVDGDNIVLSTPHNITDTHFDVYINDFEGNSVSDASVHWIAFVPDSRVRCLGGISDTGGQESVYINFDESINLRENENIIVLTNVEKERAFLSGAIQANNDGFTMWASDGQDNPVIAQIYWVAVVPSEENGFQGSVQNLNNGDIVTFDAEFINPSVCVCNSSTSGVIAGALSSNQSKFTVGLSTDQAEVSWLAFGGAMPSLQTGQIEINSTPDGATVYLDGSERGLTPVTIPDLLPGEYTVTLHLQDYNDYERTIVVSPGETAIIEKDLSEIPGNIVVNSDPSGVTIKIDGSTHYPLYWDNEQHRYVNPEYGMTQIDTVNLHPIQPGEHTLTLELENYATWSETYDLEPEGTWNVQAVLEPDPGTISVTSTQPGTRIFLAEGDWTEHPDSEEIAWIDKGTTLEPDIYGTPVPLVLENIATGQYTIKCFQDYYQDIIQTTQVNSNQITEVNFDLVPISAYVKIIARDEQEIFLSGAYTNFSPCFGQGCSQGPTNENGISEGSLNAGYYTVTVWKQNYFSFTENIEITGIYTEENPLEVYATLEGKPGSINVTSTPSGATIYLGGKDQPSTTDDWGESRGVTGVNPLIIDEIAQGTYPLKLFLPGYIPDGLSSEIVVPSEGYPYITTVTVNPGITSLVSQSFRQATGKVRVNSNEGNAEIFIDNVSKGLLPTSMDGGVYSKLFEGIPTGTHTVQVSKNGFVSGSMSDTVMVSYNTEVVFDANLYQPQGLTAFINATPLYGNPGLEVTFNGEGFATEGNTIESYHWDFNDNDAFSDEQNPTHTFTVFGDYDVSLTVTDSAGETSPEKYVCIRVRDQNIVQPALGCLTIFYDDIDTSVQGETTYSENILINGFLKVDNPETETEDDGEVTVKDDGSITVTGNLITGNNTIDVAFAAINDGGSFTIGEKCSDDYGVCYRSIGDISFNFPLYGLDVSVSDLKLYENRLSISGSISPSQGALSDLEIELVISVSSEGLNFGGGIELPDFAIAGFGIKGAFLNLDLGCEGGNCWEAGITFKLPPVVGISVGGKLGIQNGNLNSVSVKVSGFTPPVPIGNTGVFLESLIGGLENIPPDPEPLVFNAGAGFYAGPKIPPTGEIPPFTLLGMDFGGKAYHLLGGNVNLEVDCGGSFTAEGDAYILEDSFGHIGDAGFTILFPRGLRLWGNIFYPLSEEFAILEGALRSKLDLLPDLEFQASVEGIAKIPEFCPIMGGYTFGDAVGYIDNDLIAVGASMDCYLFSLDGCVMFSFDDPGLSFATNWDAIQEVDLTSAPQFLQASRMDAPLVFAGLGTPILGQSHNSYAISSTTRANPTVEQVLPEGLEVVIFYMQMTSEGIPPNFKVTTPDGVEFEEESTEVFWRHNDAAGDLWCAVPKPEAGKWTVTPDASLSGSEYKIAIYQLNEKPTLAITFPKEDIVVEEGMNIPITWKAGDSDDEAMVRLCYSDSPLQLGKSNLPAWPGNTIIKNLSEENLKSTYNWDTTGVAPGKYYIYGVITDGKNFPVFAWSKSSVTIQRKDFPPPKGVSAHQNDSTVQVEWDSVPGATGYRVYYQNVNKDAPLTVAVSQGTWENMVKESPDLEKEGPMAISQAVWEETTTKLGHLEHGVTYRIAVTAFKEDGLESDYSKFIEVTY